MSDNKTLFKLPTVPDEFGVVLTPTNLRRIDFSGLDYPTARRAIIEYIKTYFPDDFNDFIASSGIIMIMEIVSNVVAKLSLRADILANEATLPTAITEEAVVNHLALINQRIKRQTPAITDIEVSVDQPLFTDLEIEPGTSFSTSGTDGQSVYYEIYRAPGDWTGKIVIPAGKRGVIAYGLEGQFGNPIIVTSSGGSNQRFILEEPMMLESPIFVYVTVGNTREEWKVVTEPLERYGPTDKVVEVNFIDNRTIFRFGDDVTGQAPLSGSTIEFRFRSGGGRRGRIGVGQIDTSRQLTPLPPANAAVSVRFRNVTPSVGGTDRETIEQAKKRAPRDFSLQGSIVTADDYAQAAISFTHPVFGSISKAIATLRSSLNANRVELYVLAEGPDKLPTIPNAGLKAGLITYFSDLNVLADHVVVLDGKTKPVDIELNVIMNRNADATVVRERVESAITDFFDLTRWNMGQAFYISNFIDIIESVDGVSYVDLLQPYNNIIPTGELGDPNSDGIGFNEVIIEGKRKSTYYYEKSPPPGGIRSGQ